MLTELLGSIQSSRSVPLATTIMERTDINDCIWDGGPPTEESILLIGAINTLRAEFPDLTSQFTTPLTNGTLTLDYIADRLAIKQQSITSAALATTVLVANNSTNPFQKKPCVVDVCANKANCGETG